MIKQYIDNYLSKFTPYKENKCWCYEDGVILTAAKKMYETFNELNYLDLIFDYFNAKINVKGEMYLCNLTEYNIDNVQAGNVLYFAYDYFRKEKFNLAIEQLYSQLLTHPRTKEGNFWHKNRYPYQVWLDGLYMGQPFYALFAKTRNKKEIYNDILSQFKNVRKYLFDEKRRLYIHAYDELKEMQWANKNDGKSPNVWSRSVGWLAMALVDVYEIMKDETDESAILASLLKELMIGILPYIDKASSMWYQIVDMNKLEGNYLETSGSAMLAYAFMKGYRLKILDSSYYEVGKNAFKGIVNKYLKEVDGEVRLGGICRVAGLDNQKRDGSINYYLSEEVVYDDAKGVAPFILAYCELLLND